MDGVIIWGFQDAVNHIVISELIRNICFALLTLMGLRRKVSDLQVTF